MVHAPPAEVRRVVAPDAQSDPEAAEEEDRVPELSFLRAESAPTGREVKMGHTKYITSHPTKFQESSQIVCISLKILTISQSLRKFMKLNYSDQITSKFC